MSRKAGLATRDAALLLLVSLIWGCNFLVIKWGLASMPPLLFTALRFLACAVPWIFVVPRPLVGWGALVALGAVLGVGVFGFLFTGIAAGVPPGLASLLMQAQVFFTAALAMCTGDRLPAYRVSAVVLGLVGIAIVAGHDIPSTAHGLGVALVIAGAFCWGLANMMLRRMPTANMLGVMVWISLVPPLPLLMLAATTGGPEAVWASIVHMGWQAVAAVLYTALLSTIIGYGLWGWMLQRYQTTVVAQFSLLVPVFGLLSTGFVYGERHSAVENAAIIVVLLSLALSLYGHKLSVLMMRAAQNDVRG